LSEIRERSNTIRATTATARMKRADAWQLPSQHWTDGRPT